MEPRPASVPSTTRLRQAIRIRGTVQGVGFRPAVHRLAGALGLGGCVRNDSEGVWIEIEGERDAIDRFRSELPLAAPATARIESASATWIAALGETRFRITQSDDGGRIRTAIPADLAPCDDCLGELADPLDRRHRYPFINCTACGPRYTIARAVPYDRALTTMDAFGLCGACRREYEDPSDRRFHAEPTACPVCGPRLSWIAPGARRVGEAALVAAVVALREGAIVAVKGAGGFLLATDAGNEDAVRLLRLRKRRPHQPFAVMARSLVEARRVATVDETAERVLRSAARPIVLLPMRADSDLAASIAPGLVEVGVFLPPTPLQHLLATEGPSLLVMTSGNPGGEPIVKDDAEALARLSPLADAFLVHDREIHTRADDSVMRVIAGVARPLRRARGYVPDPIPLPVSGPPLLAVGGAQRSTVCLARDGQAFVSQHLGDLDDPDTLELFEETIEKLGKLVGVRPSAVVHDLHPDYPSTRWATHWALDAGLPCIGVQHHHAHVAACLAEHAFEGPVLGIAFDGTGCGPGGELWGGEILEADLGGYRRIGHLQALGLPGGEAAIREPWRLAVMALVAAGEERRIDRLIHLGGGIDRDRLRGVRQLIDKQVVCPEATGAGRWFDAVSALLGLRHEISYEGQAAIELEAAAAPERVAPYPLVFETPPGAPFVIDLRPAVREIAAELSGGLARSIVAARFHETLAGAIAEACRRARVLGGPATVALSGGCFGNRLLTERTRELLEADGFQVLLHRLVPPGDGGLSLGQAAVASFRLRPPTHPINDETSEPCA